MPDQPISLKASASTFTDADVLAGVQGGVTKKFSGSVLAGGAALTSRYPRVVNHGATAATGRVGTAPHLWIGSVNPTNATDNDQLYRTDQTAWYVRVGGVWVELFASRPIYADAASGLFLLAGTPSTAVFVSRRLAWFLDADTTEAVGARFHIPAGWTSVTLSLDWSVPSSSGDVDLQVTMYQAGNATSLGSAAISTTDLILTAPAVNVMKRSTLVANQAVTGDRDLAVRLYRRGGNAGDTLAADMAVLSLDIVKVA
jgi:hypothetical protein